MSSKHTYLEVYNLDKREEEPAESHNLEDIERLSVGRRAPGSEPNIVLDPDPQRRVGRLHCMFERAAGQWYLTDNATLNGTLLRRHDETVRVEGRVRLRDLDEILILREITEKGEPLRWKLRFLDRYETVGAEVGEVLDELALARSYLEYDWVQLKLFRHHGGRREEIELDKNGPQHTFIRYLADKSRQNGGVSAGADYEELKMGIFGDTQRADERVREVVQKLREKIEPDPKNPRLLETVRGVGYRLMCRGTN